jgi:hypothetical protein
MRQTGAGNSVDDMKSHRSPEREGVDNLEKQKDLVVLLQTHQYIALDVVEIERRSGHAAPAPQLRVENWTARHASSRARFTSSFRWGGARREPEPGPRQGVLAAITPGIADQQMLGGHDAMSAFHRITVRDAQGSRDFMSIALEVPRSLVIVDFHVVLTKIRR